MRSKTAKRCYRSIAKRCSRRSKHREAIEASRSNAPGSQKMTRRGLKGEAPPARHHRAIADAPRGIILLTSRVSIFYIRRYLRILKTYPNLIFFLINTYFNLKTDQKSNLRSHKQSHTQKSRDLIKFPERTLSLPGLLFVYVARVRSAKLIMPCILITKPSQMRSIRPGEPKANPAGRDNLLFWILWRSHPRRGLV